MLGVPLTGIPSNVTVFTTSWKQQVEFQGEGGHFLNGIIFQESSPKPGILT